MTDLDQLYRSLGERRRPDDVADWIEHVLAGELTGDEARVLATAAWPAQRRRLKARLSMPEVDVEARLRDRIAALAAEVGVTPGHCDFLTDRLDRALRRDARIFISKRRYNRTFRRLRRLEAKLAALPRRRAQADVIAVGASRLATRISHERFVQSRASACFIAYFVACASRRGEFTIDGQELPLDEVGAMLLARCARAPDASWFAIAHVHPTTAVLARLDEPRKLEMFGLWGSMMQRLADLLAEVWTRSSFDRATMVVRRRIDSTAWNQLARAWNQVRAGWMTMAQAIGAAHLLDRACPGKAMRLVGRDFEDWHRSIGPQPEPDTRVWAELPLPWQVVRGEAVCGRVEIERACARAGVDPVASGWTASR